MPEALLAVLDAVHGEAGAAPARVVHAVQLDPVIAARLLATANLPQEARAVQNAVDGVSRLGLEAVERLAVGLAVDHLFDGASGRGNAFSDEVWVRSLRSAAIAARLAESVDYPDPNQAYLCGLLCDIGQLILLGRHGEAYLDAVVGAEDAAALLQAEHEFAEQGHPEVGADFLEACRVSRWMADAIRYQHEEGMLLLDAHPLCKIVNVAVLLSEVQGAGLDAAAQALLLLGLEPSTIARVREHAAEDVDRLLASLGFESGGERPARAHDASGRLASRIRDIHRLGQARAELQGPWARQDLHPALARAIAVSLGLSSFILFSLDAAGQRLQARGAEESELSLTLEAGRSLLADCLLQARPLESAERPELPVVDRQIARALGTESMLCLPLVGPDQQEGVLVLGVDKVDAVSLELAQAVAHELALLVSQLRVGFVAGDKWLRREIAEAVHEAGNPLSSIGNYLEMLRIRLQDDREAVEEVEIIRQEIERVSVILRRLRSAPEEGAERDPAVELNGLVEDLTRLFRASTFTVRKLRLETQLEAEAVHARASPEQLKQVLINLIKNAAEAQGEGGSVTLRTTGSVSVGPRRYVGVSVEDAGPGIPPDRLSTLFEAQPSTKREGHAGLGLSITKRLVDSMEGLILCSSGSSGTRFDVLIPATRAAAPAAGVSGGAEGQGKRRGAKSG
jgi:signal transduction histidine kinase/HD-like signal output (HDOD) protein